VSEPKNVIIYSDGTGQAGGFRFDEKRSNIYKMYRATRCGPDSSIDPQKQIAFYDPGLGSQADGGHLAGRLARWIYNTVSQATGFGITANMIDCYAALIRLWRPGDRIFLFGFSRGAYTVRCLAGVIAFCGIPTRMGAKEELRLDETSTRKLAGYAVKHVYQFTASRRTEDATRRERFLLDARSRIGERFREEHGCNNGSKANVYPYFIGVFDTVASLGSARKSVLLSIAFFAIAAIVSAAISYLSLLPEAPVFGSFFSQLTFLHVFGGVIAITCLSVLAGFIYTHTKFDFDIPGYTLWQKFATFHFTQIWQKFYDHDLNENVGYAKHALSIDENRKDFAREPWGYSDLKHATPDQHGNLWFEQVWFAGNHSDIGGSYPENESRLSDSTLQWMSECASAVPHGLQFDGQVLQLSPDPGGMQHDEVAAGLGLLTKLFGITWARKDRKLQSRRAVIHSSVYKRFDLPEVQVYDRLKPYRPSVLRNHVDFERYYEPGATFPADSFQHATATAAEPPSHIG
jgi:uncharacterized protein (DUF2235 family)